MAQRAKFTSRSSKFRYVATALSTALVIVSTRSHRGRISVALGAMARHTVDLGVLIVRKAKGFHGSTLKAGGATLAAACRTARQDQAAEQRTEVANVNAIGQGC